MKTLIYLENEKKMLIRSLRVSRIIWKNEYLKDRSAHLRYENYMNSFFPRSIVFKSVMKYYSWITLLISYFLWKKNFFSYLLKKVF